MRIIQDGLTINFGNSWIFIELLSQFVYVNTHSRQSIYAEYYAMFLNVFSARFCYVRNEILVAIRMRVVDEVETEDIGRLSLLLLELFLVLQRELVPGRGA